MSAPKPCMVDGCGRPKKSGKHKCYWHWLLSTTPEEQVTEAKLRFADWANGGADPRKTVPKKDWPEGERWCAKCQGFVPLFYCTGSVCKAHASLKAHAARIEKLYGITEDDYDDLMRLQGGVCYVCSQRPRGKRLAVDHDHHTGRVRGLLCADFERGCNKAVLGSLEARAVDSPVAAAQRLISYLNDPPYDRLMRSRDARHAARPEEVPDLPDPGGPAAPEGFAIRLDPAYAVPEWLSDPEWQF